MEFQLWLLDENLPKFEDMQSKKEQREFFKKFVKKWNRGDLDEKFYDEKVVEQTLSNHRTNYKWNFKSDNKENDKEDDAPIGPTFEPYKGEVHAPLPSQAMMTEEDKREYDKKMAKMDRKKFNKDQKEAMEDFAPRSSTAFESRVDQSKLRAQQRREKDADDGYSVNEYDDDNAFNSILNKENGRKKKIVDDRRDFVAERLEKYREKEERTMALLKSLAAANGYL